VSHVVPDGIELGLVIPAQAGIWRTVTYWMPAFAGMTDDSDVALGLLERSV
jgi:hypothetical protein